ncbi:hypothetical protein BDF14DRAFT_1820240, partial [Spinellus fusiger]
MDFSPYKPSPDEDRTQRLKKERNHQKKKEKSKNVDTFVPSHNVFSSGEPNVGSSSASFLEQGLYGDTAGLGGSLRGASSDTLRVNKYETSLPIRVDIEAALAYVLGPITGLLLLVLETQNDYVRFHAWQSSMVFLALMCLHFFIVFISSVLSWMLLMASVALLLWLTYHAYLDGASLERYELPYFGPIASDYVDS